MPTDVGLILATLTLFYDFRQKAVVHVGAGGGQMIGYAGSTRHVVAVDRDASSIKHLEQKVRELALERTVRVVSGDFHDLDLAGDVVLFEFCLHEMERKEAAIARARREAPDVVVIDHLPESRWSWYAHEEDQMAGAWRAIEAAGIRKRRRHEAVQRFDTFADLRTRLAAQGEESRRRLSALEGGTPLSIPMPYGIALL